MAPRSSHDQLIHCDSCGEDYSATYRKCPFCGARNDPRKASAPISPAAPVRDDEELDDGYVFDGQGLFDDEPEEGAPARGGKRLADGQRDWDNPLHQVNWPRLITFLCSLVIIIAALVIVFTWIYPMLHNNTSGGNSHGSESSQSPASDPGTVSSDPVTDASEAPSGEAEPSEGVGSSEGAQPSADVQPSGAVSGGLVGFTLSSYDFTLAPAGDSNDSYRMVVTFDPQSWSGDITWSSSDERYATVDASGRVKNVNTTSSLHMVIITVTAGGISQECKVYCRGQEAATEPSAEPTASTAPSGGNVAAGTKGTIVNAAGGLNVRSGPGTSYSRIASLSNGDTVTVVRDAGDGWYEISFAGAGGTATTGYIMGTYISFN